jgi:hypothetical protein
MKAAAIAALATLVFLPDDLSVLGGLLGAFAPVAVVQAEEQPSAQ